MSSLLERWKFRICLLKDYLDLRRELMRIITSYYRISQNLKGFISHFLLQFPYIFELLLYKCYFKLSLISEFRPNSYIFRFGSSSNLSALIILFFLFPKHVLLLPFLCYYYIISYICIC